MIRPLSFSTVTGEMRPGIGLMLFPATSTSEQAGDLGV